MSGLLLLQVWAHVTAQPLKVALVVCGSPTAPCALLKAACSFILDTTAVSSDVGLHVPSGGGGDGGGGEGLGGDGGIGLGGGGDGGGGDGGGGEGGGSDGEGGGSDGEGDGGGGDGGGGLGLGGGGEGGGGGGGEGGGPGLGLGGGGDGGDEGERYETTAVRCACSVTGALPSRPSRTHKTYGLCAAESCTVIWLLESRKPPLLLGADAGHEDEDAGMKKR